jgi:hypothetical protein
VASHPRPQPPQTRAPPAPQEPPAGPLQPPASHEPSVGPLRPTTCREPPSGPPAAPLLSSVVGPHRSKPQERPSVGVGRPKCPANKNNDKIYQMKQ